MAQRSVVRPEEIRRHNLGLLLRQIHQHGELTRAELTALLGLNRSTIGGLVTDLVSLGMVTEYVPAGRDRAGRPSYVVAPRPDGPYVLAIKVEVERIVTAAVGIGGTVHARRQTVIDQPPGPAEAIRQIVRDARWLATRLPEKATLIGAGVSVPGTVRRDDGLVVEAPNLDWHEVPFASLLAARLGGQLGVQVGNDANLGALAEHQRGAAVGMDNVIYLNGSVGVGGGIIADGAELHGTGGYAGEIGHMMLNPDGPVCHCGSSGCIETYIGEHALLRAAGYSGPYGPDAAEAVFIAAANGDERALGAVDEVSLWLARTLATLVNVFNPQAVIVGGSLSQVVRLSPRILEAELRKRAMSAARQHVEILPPGLGDESELVGAAELAFQVLLTAPDSSGSSAAVAN